MRRKSTMPAPVKLEFPPEFYQELARMVREMMNELAIKRAALGKIKEAG